MKSKSEKIAMITAYDHAMARLADAAGADMVLVGDSLGMVVQGQPDTLRVTVHDMIYHGRCVAAGLQRAHLTIDLPFMSYQLGPRQALKNAGRLVKEGLAQSVKIEGGMRSAQSIKMMVDSGIPVIGHIGLTPQSVHALGGFKVQGRDASAQERIMEDALAIQEAGVFAVVLEMIPGDLAARLTATLQIPTIGIGAGPGCDGQVLVCNDMLGMDLTFKPRFVKHYAELDNVIRKAVKQYVSEVKGGQFPTNEHSFT
jgi:3-methyl-2-oxobutanoate hydroxymethyltransferase